MNNSSHSEPLEVNPTNESMMLQPQPTDLSQSGQDLNDGEVIRIELFEEVPTIHRETVVREKVQIRKISTEENV